MMEPGIQQQHFTKKEDQLLYLLISLCREKWHLFIFNQQAEADAMARVGEPLYTVPVGMSKKIVLA